MRRTWRLHGCNNECLLSSLGTMMVPLHTAQPELLTLISAFTTMHFAQTMAGSEFSRFSAWIWHFITPLV